MFNIKTKEKLNLNASISAYYAPLNRLAQKGLMLLNASAVEPGYSGPLSCFLVNFSAQDVVITKDQEIAKITFHKLDGPIADYKPSVVSDKDYGIELSKSARLFHRTFLGVSGIEERAVKAASASVKNSLFLGGILIAFLLLFSQLEPIFSKFLWEKLGVITTTTRVDELKLNNELIASKEALDSIRNKIKDADELSTLKNRIDELEKKQSIMEKNKSKIKN